MTDAEFLAKLKALRDRYNALLAEAKPKQERYDALRKEMCGLVGEDRVEAWEEGTRMRSFNGPPDWIGTAKRDIRRELYELVYRYEPIMTEDLLPKEYNRG